MELLWAINKDWATFLNLEVLQNSILLIERNVCFVLYLIAQLSIHVLRWVSMLWVMLMITLIGLLLNILRLQMNIIECFSHMYCCLNAIIGFFLWLFNHYIISQILLFSTLVIILSVCAMRLPICYSILITSWTRILSWICSFILHINQLGSNCLNLLVVTTILGEHCIVILWV